MKIKHSLLFTKNLSLVCAGLLFLSLFHLPIVFYELLHIVTILGAIGGIYSRYLHKDYLWCIVFALIIALFNPFTTWFWVLSLKDFILYGLIAMLFLINYYKKHTFSYKETSATPRSHSRDRFY